MKYELTVNEHPDIINCIRLRSYEMIYEDANGICILDKINNYYYADAIDKQTADTILNIVDGKSDIVIRGEAMKQAALDYKLQLSKPYQFAVYMEPVPQNEPIIPFEIRPLSLTHLAEICARYSYKALADKSYLSGRIKDGMLGAFKDNQLIAFIGIHDCGSIGLLEVSESYRRLNIGTALVKEMIKKQLQRDMIPYAELFIDNEKSHKLAEKLHLQLSESLIYWAESHVDTL